MSLFTYEFIVEMSFFQANNVPTESVVNAFKLISSLTPPAKMKD